LLDVAFTELLMHAVFWLALLGRLLAMELLVLLMTWELTLCKHVLALSLGLRGCEVVLSLSLVLAGLLSLVLAFIHLLLLAVVNLLHLPHLLRNRLLTIHGVLLSIVLRWLILRWLLGGLGRGLMGTGVFVLAALVLGRGVVAAIRLVGCRVGSAEGRSRDAKGLRPLSIGFHL